MFDTVAALAASWSSWYSNSSALRTAIGFAHIGGLVLSGGCALVEDRAVLTIPKGDLDAQRRQLLRHPGAHRAVVAGLAIVIVSGLLMLLSDPGTFLHSRLFWIKMGLVFAIFVNGALMTRTWRTLIPRDAGRWSRLRREAGTSLVLWILTTLLGAALPNV